MAALLTCLAASSGYIPTGGYQAISVYAISSRIAATSRLEATSPVRTAVSPICCALPDAASMRGKALKEELDGLGVAWKGVAFEKEELVKMVEDARANPPASPPPPPPPPPPPRPPAPSTPPIETWRRSNSPGLQNNFYDAPSSDFRKPYGGPSPPPPPAPPPTPPPPQAAPRAATAPAGAKFCSQCGAAVTPTSKFCAECGVPLAAAGTVADEGTRDSSRAASAPAAASSVSVSGGGGGVSGGDGADPVTMRVAQIKAELKERSIAFSDCFDKDGLTELYPYPHPYPQP